MQDPVLMLHPDRPTDTTYVERDAYRNEWFPKGWVSNDDPSFTGTVFDDLQRFVTVPPAWGERWRESRQAASSRLVRVLVVSDSIGAGELSTNWRTTAWVSLVQLALQARYGDGGSGFMSAGWKGGANSGVTSTGAWTETITNGPPASSEGGIGAYSVKPTVSGNGATLTFTFRGTTLDIFTKTDPAFGRVDYAIDGGSTVQVALNSTASIKTNTITGLSAGSHTVVLTAAAGDSRIFGIRGRNATGIIVENVSTSGRRVADMAWPTTNIASRTAIQDTIAALGKIDVAIISLGPNDAIFNETTTIQDTLWDGLDEAHSQIITNGLVTAKPPDIITLIEHIGTADTLVPFGFLKKDWLQVTSVLRDFSGGAGAALVDVWAAGRHSWDYWFARTYWGGGSNNDAVHPNDAGHAVYAAPIISLLT